jgi:hypothetical protein
MMGGTESFVGDASFNGWATFCVYLATAALCFFNAQRSAALAVGRHVALARSRRRFWLVLTVLLLVLGLSRELDLQRLAAAAMRALLRDDGVYGERSGLQVALVVAIGAFGMIGLLIALVSFRRVEVSVLAAMAGAALLTIFTMIRTISLHDIDRLLMQGVGVPHAQINNVIEIGALLLVAAAAYGFTRQLHDEGEAARLRDLKIRERRRQLGEKRRASRS